MELVEMRLQNAGETPLLFAGLQPGGFTSPSLTPQDRQNIANEVTASISLAQYDKTSSLLGDIKSGLFYLSKHVIHAQLMASNYTQLTTAIPLPVVLSAGLGQRLSNN